MGGTNGRIKGGTKREAIYFPALGSSSINESSISGQQVPLWSLLSSQILIVAMNMSPGDIGSPSLLYMIFTVTYLWIFLHFAPAPSPSTTFINNYIYQIPSEISGILSIFLVRHWLLHRHLLLDINKQISVCTHPHLVKGMQAKPPRTINRIWNQIQEIKRQLTSNRHIKYNLHSIIGDVFTIRRIKW